MVKTLENRIKASLADLPGARFRGGCARPSDRPGLPKRADDNQSVRHRCRVYVPFQYSQDNGTKTGKDFLENAVSVRLLFQLTDSEIATARQPHLPLPEAELFNCGLLQSFFFVTVELDGQHYARGRYAQFVREINKWSQSPTVVLFKTAADLLTLAFVHRRQHKRNPDRDVLGRVSLVREIDPTHGRISAHIRHPGRAIVGQTG